MASPAEGFTRLQKIAIFLLVVGQEKAREILADVDLEAIERINATIASLGPLAPEVKAAVMIEFAGFFYEDKPLLGKAQKAGGKKTAAAQPDAKTSKKKRPATSQSDAKTSKKKRPATSQPGAKASKQQPPQTSPASTPKDDEATILETLRKLRERVDPGKIDWSRAGYDFGEGFKGPEKDRR